MVKKDYSKLSKEELLATVKKLEKEKSPKKYGLVWEHHEEDVVKQCQVEFPVLKEISKLAIEKAQGKSTNLIIEGDNYHTLSVLNYTHSGKIDVIYIDPPYNTGAEDWKYNNKFVDLNDTYRHSKWLSMMEKRIRLAKNLLTDEGVFICTIDHNEQERLGLLLQEIFPDKMITCVTIVHNPAGVQGENFSYTHEYAYFVYPKYGRSIDFLVRDDGELDVRNFRDVTGEESIRTAAANCFYPIYVKDGKIIGFGEVLDNAIHPKSINIKHKDGTVAVYPIDPQGVERKWRFARQTVESIKNDLRVKFIKTRRVWDIIRVKNRFNYKTVWVDSKYSANNYGTQLLNKIIKPGSFSYPKSLHAVIDCIRAASYRKKNPIILDFFAGSGTTGHAVLCLNQKDGGNRRFILCTNNENKIAEEVTYPRIKKVIFGYAKEKAILANVRYFKTSFVKKTVSRDEQKLRITDKCTEMLCVREGVYKLKSEKPAYKIFSEGFRTMAVYYSMNRKALSTLAKELVKYKGDKVLYCFTLGTDLDEADFDDWENVRLEPIPQKILDIYKEIHER